MNRFIQFECGDPAFYRNALAFVFLPMRIRPAAAGGDGAWVSGDCFELLGFSGGGGGSGGAFDPDSIESMALQIRRVILDEEFRTWLIRKQSERVPLFSWATVADRTWSAIGELLAVEAGKSRVSGVAASLEERRAVLIAKVAVQLRGAGAGYRDFVHAGGGN